MKHVWVMILLLPAPAIAGAWLQNTGDTLLSRQAIYYSTDRYFDAQGNLTTQNPFRKIEGNLYAEYGWNDTLTLGTNLFLNRVAQNGEENIGLADSEFFARLMLWKGERSVVSLQPLIKLPSMYQNAGTPRGGSDSTDSEISLLFGHSFTFISTHDYLDLRAGYRERSDGLNGQWRGDIAYGIQLSDQWQVVSAVRAIQAAQVSREAFSNSGELDYDLGKAELTALYQVNEELSWQFSYFAHVVGRQTGAGHGIALGLTQRF